MTSTTPPAAAHRHHPSSTTSNSSSRGCRRCLFLLLSFLTLLILAAVLIIVLAVKPRKPQFDLQQVGFQYMGISPGAAATQSAAAAVSLIIHMLFVATNDNKVGIKYDEFSFTVMYRGIPLGRGAVPGFYQAAHNVSLVETTIVVDRANLIQANAADILGEASLNDRVALRVVGDVGARIRILGLTSPRVQVSVDCIIAISPTRQSLMSKQCGFDGLSV
ncbi:NDR1/HIN1-like protein 13 [Henckelia pumila]|uniref:NDR1/HIN1-like protein 13 n=1 Tax=Henckelia pumila TaxID=405737 RepID=UPI003C6DD24E